MIVEKVEEKDEPYLTFEELDEQQIAEEMQGIYATTLVYSFEDKKGRKITGLSIKGVYEVAKSLVRHGYDVTVKEAKITEETEIEYKASCEATFKAPNGHILTTFGYSKANKFYSKGDPSEFAYVQALSKAQRNALRTLIPEKFAAKCIEQFLAEKGGRVKNITPPSVQTVPEKQIGFAGDVDKILCVGGVGGLDVVIRQNPEIQKPDKDWEWKALEKPTEKKPELTIPTERKVILRFLKDVPQFVGIDMKLYGPFKAEDTGNVPEPNVASLIKDGMAEEVFGEEKKKAQAEEVLNRADLTYQGKKYGGITRREGEIEVVFDPPIPNDTSIIGNFLCGRVLDTMKVAAEAENPPAMIDYQVDDKEDGHFVWGIHIIGDLTERNFKDLIGRCAWAAAKATEKKT